MKTLKQFRRRNNASAADLRTAEAPLIYAVDDVPELTELYAALLEAAGYRVKTFHDRAQALGAFKVDRTKPDLRMMDFLGCLTPRDGFLRHCLGVHPTLRILMASGFNQADIGFSRARPDRFIQKPLTPDKPQQEVCAAPAA